MSDSIKPIRIVIVDDSPIVREGVRAILESETDFQIIGEGSDGDEALTLAATLNPDILLLDVIMPGTNGIEAARRIRQENTCRHIVALSAHADRQYIHEMVRAGVDGYLLKDYVHEEIVPALHQVMKGRFYLSLSLFRRVRSDLEAHSNAAPAAGSEVLDALDRFLKESGAPDSTEHEAERLNRELLCILGHWIRLLEEQ